MHRKLVVAIGLVLISPLTVHAAKSTTSSPATTKAAPPQQLCLPEHDGHSPRRSKLKAAKPDPAEIVRIDVDGDGDPDILETWWNGKRVRWIDGDDDMRWTDVRGDMSSDSFQVDRDGDGYYDGPGDLNIKWADDDGDGKPDVQLFAANPTSDQRTIRSGTSHWMIFIDQDHDGVNGYMDWTTWEFSRINWRVPPTTSPTHTIPPPNFSPDYDGDAVFLKQHLPAWAVTDPRYNWENPFAFYDFDGDGCTEMSIRLLDTTTKQKGGDDGTLNQTYRGYANEAMGGIDLDNDSQKGNEFDFDMSFRFFSAEDGSRGDRIDYRRYHNKHAGIKAPQWVLDGHYFRYDNWRKINEFIYVPHEKCFDEMWHTNWGSCWMTFDEDDDDHRWERVEFQYPTSNPYSTERWASSRGNKGSQALAGHPQADSLGDRGEWDEDNSGKGKLYIGRWDGKLHLFGAEKGAWTIDEHARYWGSWPVLGNSSPDNATKIGELVQYRDTDNNGFFDEITFDYDCDKTVDLKINLLDYKTDKDPHPDVRQLYNPADLRYQGLHELFCKMSKLDFQEGLKVYRAAWKKGITTKEIDDLAFASSIGEQYDHGYWLKEKIFRVVDQHLSKSGDKSKRDALRRAYFTHDLDGAIAVIDSLDPSPQHK